MARFYGEIGYAEMAETAPGVWEEVMREYPYYGDVLRQSRTMENGQSVNNNVFVNNSISIVADAYANEHFHAMRYIRWMGSLWKVTNVEVQRPRLILTIGGLWNGNAD